MGIWENTLLLTWCVLLNHTKALSLQSLPSGFLSEFLALKSFYPEGYKKYFWKKIKGPIVILCHTKLQEYLSKFCIHGPGCIGFVFNPTQPLYSLDEISNPIQFIGYISFCQAYQIVWAFFFKPINWGFQSIIYVHFIIVYCVWYFKFYQN